MNFRKDRKHLGKAAALGCIICGAEATVHHVRKYGEKKDDHKTFALCPKHHQTGGYGVAIEEGKETWEENFGSAVGFVMETYRLLKEEPLEYVVEWAAEHGEVA
jgi:hypothetical protein